ncbi:MAG: tetratricopeptide repeat protein [Candidatus Thiodiazotropha endolucinida]|nr:tetratricopeptide repeat protein [Candidatus Thiodiazotropha sp. (ex Lucina pensylvanica)]MCG8024400.1 tetratricopeptide repeat protein [Candidatus Thiodiazotropha endolucinida]
MQRENLEKMLEQGNDNALLRYTLGSLCLKEKDADMAVRHLTEALKQDPNHSASWKLYGKALAALNREEEARKAYRKGIAVAEARGDVQAAKEMGVFLKRLE